MRFKKNILLIYFLFWDAALLLLGGIFSLILAEFIEDEKQISPSLEASRTLLRERLNEILVDLTPREQKILNMRFGLEDGISHTLEEVGKEFGVTRERIRQIEAKALSRIKGHEKAYTLEGY